VPAPPPSPNQVIGRLELIYKQQRRYARFPRLARQAGLVHAFSTRPEDVSARVDALAKQREANRSQMAVDLGLDPARLHYCVQVHETRIARIDGTSAAGRLEGFDGASTNVPGAALLTFSADCPLVLAFDPRRRALGMVHASWRCTVAGATRLLIEQMREAYGCRPGQLLAGIGPSAGPQRYFVREDVYEAARALPDRDRLFPKQGDGMCFDLWEANRQQLLRTGVPEENIEEARVCTLSESDVFFSFRREGAGCGHFGLMAALGR
jgi:hypothetical protein